MNGVTPIVPLPGALEEPLEHCNGATNGHVTTFASNEDALCIPSKAGSNHSDDSSQPNPSESQASKLQHRAKIATLFRTQTCSMDDEAEDHNVAMANGQVIQMRDKASDDDLNAGFKGGKDKMNSQTRAILDTFNTRELPKRESSKATQVAINVVNGRFFTTGVASLILVNAMFIGLETDFNDAESLGGRPHVGWTVAESIFTFLFIIELVLRLLSEPLKKFFSDTWNIFDTVIVVAAFIDLVTNLSTPTQDGDSSSGGSGAGNLTVLRIFRILRLARIVRLLRVFKELQLIVAGIVGSVRVLFWVWILLIMVIYIFAVFATRTIAHNHRGNQEVQDLIGKLPQSMFTFFVIMTTERWADIARSLGNTEPVSYAVILVFISITTFAIINVVIAVIVDATMCKAADVRNDASEAKKRIEKNALIKIMDVFRRADENDDGLLTKEEFLQGLEQESIRELLFSADVSLRDVNELFDILDTDASGSLTCQEFLDGVQRARGEARAKDLLELHCDVWKASRRGKSQMRDLRQDVDNAGGARLENSKNWAVDVAELRAELNKQTEHLVKALREPGLKASSLAIPEGLSEFRKRMKTQDQPGSPAAPSSDSGNAYGEPEASTWDEPSSTTPLLADNVSRGNRSNDDYPY